MQTNLQEIKDGRLEDIIQDLAAKFIQLESNYTSLITVTGVTVSDHGKKALIFFTVLPEDKEEGVLDFMKRKRGEFREYVQEHSRIGRIPFFDFILDVGEKNRQHIDEISRSI